MPVSPYEISYTSEAIAFCRELVRAPSLPGEERAVADLVAAEMSLLGYDQVLRDALGDVVGIVRGAGQGPTVLYAAHMDTAPVVAPARWRYEPYAADQGEGRLWGRGVVDAKGSLAAAILALGALPRRHLAGQAIVCATVGGERLPGAALAHVLQHFVADRVVICEPTGLAVGLGQKGRAGLTLAADGAPAPASRPDLGVNAIYLAIEGIARLRAMPLPQDDLLGSGTFEVLGMVSEPHPGRHAETDVRVVPDRCLVTLERRLVRGETREGVLAGEQRALAGLRGVELSVQRGELRTYTGQALAADDYYPAWVGALDDPAVQQVRRALAAAGLPDGIYLAPYASDGVASAVGRQLPTILYGPGEIEKAHGIDESLRVDELQAAFSGYQILARAFGQACGNL